MPSLVLGLLILGLFAEWLSRFSPLLLLVALDFSDGVLLALFDGFGGFPSTLSRPSGLNRCHTVQLIGWHPSIPHA